MRGVFDALHQHSSYYIVGTSVKRLKREYSNISLTNALEIYAPRGQILKLINIFAEVNGKVQKCRA